MRINYYLKSILAIIGLLAFCSVSFSQESSGGVPISWQEKIILTNLKNDPHTIFLPIINNSYEQQRADSISITNCSTCENQYYGIGIDLPINIKTQGQLQLLPDGSKLWMLKIESPTAFGMQFYFDKFKLPEGARLFIFNEDSTMLLGGFTANNNPKDTTKAIKFGTQYIQGNKIFIEYHEPKNVSFEGEVTITKTIHVFNENGPFAVNGGSLPCNINVSCPEGNGWSDEINSVALILGIDNQNNLAAWCTGALINNTDEDGTPYFLTAKHCIDDLQNTGNSLFDYSTWLFLFNHQTTTCSSDGSDVSSFTGQSVFGSLLLEEDGVGSPTSDYLLLELNTSESVLASFGVCYAGWSLTTSPQGPFTGIHHPLGDVKKISIANNINSFSGTHWEVDWDQGTTQGGSSGSPLFDNNHKIIGQDHYGKKLATQDNCHPDKITGYGKFTTSWQNGGFAFWLDPFNTGQTSVNTYCPSNGTGSDPGGGSGPGGGSNPCASSQNRRLDVAGYFINGQRDKVIEICVNNPITLTGIHPIATCPQAFSVNIEVKTKSIFTGGCNSLPNGAYECKTPFFTCTCFYAKLFISITLVDANLNPVNPEFAKWMPFTSPELSFSGANALLPSFDLRNHLPNPYIVFQSGQTYRVKIANSYFGGWSEYTNYIHFYTDNRTINNTNITNNIYGKFITINNSTVIQPIEVVAKELITINPNSTLDAGTYRIDEGLNCNSFRIAQMGSDGVSKSGGRSYNSNINNLNEMALFEEEIDGVVNFDFSIYPNPSRGIFSIQLENNKESTLVEVFDLMSKKVLKKRSSQNNISINIENQPKGIYLVKITVGNKVFNEKIIYL